MIIVTCNHCKASTRHDNIITLQKRLLIYWGWLNKEDWLRIRIVTCVTKKCPAHMLKHNIATHKSWLTHELEQNHRQSHRNMLEHWDPQTLKETHIYTMNRSNFQHCLVVFTLNVYCFLDAEVQQEFGLWSGVFNDGTLTKVHNIFVGYFNPHNVSLHNANMMNKRLNDTPYTMHRLRCLVVFTPIWGSTAKTRVSLT